MTNVEALKALYTALGGTASDVADASTIVEVLNAIAAKYDGEDDATLNPEAIANIAAVAGSIAPTPATLIEKSITANNTYNASDDEADGYSKVIVNVATPVPETFEVEFTINVSEQGQYSVTSASKTYAELMTALNSGKNLVPSFEFTLPEGVVFSSIVIGDGFINNSGSVTAACSVVIETQGMSVNSFIYVFWSNPETFTDEFQVTMYNEV